jgi:dienelactone hydrolase
MRPYLRWLTSLPLLLTLTGCSDSDSFPGGTPSPTPTPAPRPSPPFARGPDPTVETLEASGGPFAVATLEVARSRATGYGGGTISYPEGAYEGPFGVLAVTPGYFGVRYSMSWLGPRLASHGFVVIVIDTLQPNDNAPMRAQQLAAALDQVVAYGNTSGHALHARVDGYRRGVIGHSYGGGGSLLAGANDPSLRAVIPLAPYYEIPRFPALQVPTLVVGCEKDIVASVDRMAIPIYESISPSVDKAYLELADGDHLCVETANGNKAIQGKYVVAWAKRFIDDDTRYSPFLCGAPHDAEAPGPAISDYRDNCPYE